MEKTEIIKAYLYVLSDWNSILKDIKWALLFIMLVEKDVRHLKYNVNLLVTIFKSQMSPQRTGLQMSTWKKPDFM